MPDAKTGGPFDTLETTFRTCCEAPRPLTLDGRAVAALPDRMIPLDELRAILLHPATPYATRDAAVSVLLGDARDRGGPATVGLAGVLLFGLRRAIAPLCAVCPQRRADLEAETLAGLLEAITATDPGRPRLAARLCWLARNRAKRLFDTELAEQARHQPQPHEQAPPLPYGHPDMVLANAVAEGVIVADDAALIGHTRLGDLSMQEAATALQIGVQAARKRRWRAERALAAWLSSEDYQGGPFVQTGRRTPYLADRERPRNGTPTVTAGRTSGT